MNKQISIKVNNLSNDLLRLDVFLRENLSKEVRLQKEYKDTNFTNLDFSNSKIRRLIISGCVFVNNRQITKPSYTLLQNSIVKINFELEKFFYEKQPDDIKYEVLEKDVLFEDENLIFINKPSFFPVEQTITGNRDNLHDAVVRYLWNKNKSLRNPPYVGIMHRLDRETSGVILFTKSRSVNKQVQAMFENHSFVKEYYAYVTQKDLSKKIELKKLYTVEKYMGRISIKSKAAKWGTLKESLGGVYSKTQFIFEKACVVENKKCYLVKCILFTGRTHQIRVHLSEFGFPLLGDELYGGEPAKRIYLHSSRLAGSISTENYTNNFDIISEFNI